MTRLYYTPPSDEAFQEMKDAALAVWENYKNEPLYYAEKTTRIKDIQNVGDNFMYIFAMFDMNNQRKCADKLSPETKEAVRLRMRDGGNPDYLINIILGL